MQVRKMFVAVGVIALAVTGCGSDGEQPAGGPEAKPGGIVLKVGESTTVPRNTKEGQNTEVTDLEVTATAAEKGSIDDFKDFELNAQAKASVPYYVTMKFRNLGDKPAYVGGIYGVIRAYNNNSEEIAELELQTRTLGKADFDKCKNAYPPDFLEPGAEFVNCSIYLAPSGQAFGKLVYSYFADKGSDRQQGDVTWNAG